MLVRDYRNPREPRDEGPQSARVDNPQVGGGQASGFQHSGALSQGRCPLCGIRMNKGNQRSCVKATKGAYQPDAWESMRKRGRGGFVFGSALKASA